MSSSTNPLLTNLIPGGTQNAQTLSLPYGPSGGSSTGQNPLMPGVPSSSASQPAMPYSNYGFSAYASPYANPATAPLPVGNVNTPNNPQGGQDPVNAVAQGLGDPTTQQGQHDLWGSLKNTYGEGMATTIQNFLNQGAGFNQQAVNQLLAAMQPGFNQAQQNLMQQFGSTGNRFSSGAQIGEADLMSQEQLDIGQIEAQMYEQSVNDYLSVLMGTAGAAATKQLQPSFWDQLLSGGQQAAGSFAQGVGIGVGQG